jgi:hypothetical protein
MKHYEIGFDKKWRVFTARYALSPYIKQIRFVFKGLICVFLEGEWKDQRFWTEL